MGSKFFKKGDRFLEEGGDCAVDMAAAIPVVNIGVEAGETLYHGADMVDHLADGEGGKALEEAGSAGYHAVMTFLDFVTGGTAGDAAEAIHGGLTDYHCAKALAAYVEDADADSHVGDERTPAEIAAAREDAELRASGRPYTWDEETKRNSPMVDIVPPQQQRSFPDGESPYVVGSDTTGPSVAEPNRARSPYGDWSSINAIPAAGTE